MSSRHPLPFIPGAGSFGSLKLIRAAAPVALALVGAIWVGGCDTPANQADRKAQADVARAQAALERGDQQGVIEATKALESVAATDVTPLTRAIAKSSLAQVEQNAASQTMRQIDQDDQSLHRLMFEISRLAHQVDASRAIAASYDHYDPKQAHEALSAQIAAAQGGPDKPEWFKQDNSSIPSLSAVTQKISELQGQIAKQSDELKTLTDQRTQVLDEADQADKSSEISKGQQSVDDFKRAADLRKQAGELTVRIERNQAQTIPLQNDLAVAQGQQTVLQQLIQEYQAQSQALDAGWKSVQDAVSSQGVLQKKIVGDSAPAPAADAGAASGGAAGTTAGARSILPSTAGPSLSEKADALKKLVEQLTHERSDALSNLNNAIHHYQEAATAGQAYFAILDPLIKEPANALRPELNGWKNLQAVAHPSVYRLKEALAQRQLGELYLSEVDNDTGRARLQEEVGKLLGLANVAVPDALIDPSLDDARKSAADAAADAYKKADDEVAGITGASPDPLFKLAKMQHLLTLYGEVQLARLTGDTSTAHEKFTQLITERDEAIREAQQLPPLPAEVTSAPAASAAPPS